VLLLGLDTATPAVTVALHDGGQPLAQLVTVDAHRHAELLAPSIAKVIADAGVSQRDLTGIAVGVGPGPYTGLRVGVVTAKVLGAALGIPVYGVCTLDVIAADAEGEGERSFLVATDARRRELYYARYDETGRVAGPDVSAPALIPDRQLPVAGEGPMLYPELFPLSAGPAYPAAATLCRLVAAAVARGETVTDDAAVASAGGRRAVLLPPEPLYLRRPDAREPGAPKRVTP